MTKLEPCPLHGGPATYHETGGGDERIGYNKQLSITVDCCTITMTGKTRESRNGWNCDKGEGKEALIAAWNTRPTPESAKNSDALVRRVSRAIHEHLSRRDIMQYLDNDEDCEGIACAVLSALRATDAVAEDEATVERVALALINEERRFADLEPWTSLREHPEHYWRDQIRLARAAIRALKSPVGDSRCAKGASHD